MKKDKSGPAFPQPCTENGYASNTEFEVAGGGMTLRDYFAAKSIDVASRDAEGSPQGSYFETAEGIAHRAYLLADAMLKARGAE